MTVSTITTGTDNFVTLGSGNYALDLTITESGGVGPSFDAFATTTGYSFAVNLGLDGATLTNDGRIYGDPVRPDNLFEAGGGVSLGAGVVLNEGTIAGGNATFDGGGAGLYQTGGSLTNYGEIIGGDGGSSAGGIGGAGLDLTGGVAVNDGRLVGGTAEDFGGSSSAYGAVVTGGTLINDSFISTAYVGGAGTITNYGEVQSSGLAVAVAAGGVFVNRGFISGGSTLADSPHYAVSLGAGVSLDNTGLIEGGVQAGFGGTIVDDGFLFGDQFSAGGPGTFAEGDAISFGLGDADLILGPGAILDGSVVATPSFESGETIVNHTFVPVTVINGNVLELAAGESAGTAATFNMAGTFSGFNTLAFDAGAAWELGGTSAELAGGQTITGFTHGDALRLDDFVVTADSYVAGVGLVVSDGISSETVDIAGSFTTGDFSVTEGGGETRIALTPCFAAGSHLLTPGGEIAVERLAVGDKVITLNGGEAAVVWIGRRRIDLRRHRQPTAVQPVRIAADAFGEGVPARDLVLSPDHAVFLQDYLVPAKALVNGLNVCRLDRDAVIYYHVELAAHGVIFAESLPVESYLDTGNRAQFENGGVAVALHPVFGQELREQAGCAPFAETGPVVEAARQLLGSRFVPNNPVSRAPAFGTKGQ